MLLFWFALTFGGIHASDFITEESGSQCSTQLSCEQCYQSSVLCHWCKDISPSVFSSSVDSGSCHDKMSSYGCQMGDSCSADDCGSRITCSSCKMGGCKWCASLGKCVSPLSWACALPSNCLPNEECKRLVPEFIGYQNGVPWWIIITLSMLFLLILVLWVFIIYMWYPLISVPLTGESEQLVFPTTPNRTRLILFKLGVALGSIVVLTIGVLFLLLIIYWPSSPDVSMCNVDLLWSDTLNMLVKTILSGKATVESEILITIFNPNRVGVTLNSVHGNIFYKTIPIGSLELEQMAVVPGSAVDGLGVIEFTGFENIADLFYDFNVKHNLVLSFEMTVSFTLLGRTVSTPIPRFEINVNDPPPQKYCNCRTGNNILYQ